MDDLNWVSLEIIEHISVHNMYLLNDVGTPLIEFPYEKAPLLLQVLLSGCLFCCGGFYVPYMLT